MKRNQLLQAMTLRKIGLALALLIGPLSYNACSPFSVLETADLTSESLGSVEGQKIYAKNCIGCHGTIESSSKLGRSAAQIQSAITSVSQMSNLSFLTPSDLDKLALALSPAQNSTAQQKFACNDTATRGTGDVSLRRLTRFEYENTLKDIFGTDVFKTVVSNLDNYQDDVWRTVAEFSPGHSSDGVDALFSTATALSEVVSGDPNLLQRVVPTCLLVNRVVSLSSDACDRQFIDELGLKIFRRPLTAAENDSFLAVLKGASPSDPSEKVAAVIGQMLMRPEMLFHFTNSKTRVGSRYAVDPYTVASRLSYRLLGTAPDAELYAAAKNSQLSTTTQLKAQALRLLNKPVPAGQAAYAEHMGRRFIRHFASTWLNMPSARNPDNFYSQYLNVNQQTLKDAALEEGQRFAENIIVLKSGTYSDLMTSNAAFPPNTDLAKIMGTAVSAGADDPKQSTDSRRGLFQRPILLMSSEPRTSPIHRGAGFVRDVMCNELGNPPANADAVASDAKSTLDLNTATSRQIATVSTASVSCMGCHSKINPPGFVFETFGPFGEVRTAEKIFDPNRTLVNTVAIDTATDIPVDGAVTPLRDLADFNALTRQSTQIKACLAQQLFRHTRYRAETAADNCHLAEVENYIRSGLPLLEAIATNASTEDLLWEK